jgi:hypothetical protein
MHFRTSFVIPIMLMVTMLGCGADQTGRAVPAGATAYTVEESLLGPEPAGMRLGAYSNDFWHFAWVEETTGGKQRVIVDGRPEPEYDRVGSPVWSRDGRRLGYVAERNKRCMVVVDGQPGPEWDAIGGGLVMFTSPPSPPVLPGHPVFSPDSKRVAYEARDGQKWRMVVDGQAGPAYDSVAFSFRFSADGKHFIYTGKNGQKPQVVIDGQASPEYESIGFPIFSREGWHFGYTADLAGKHFVVIDGEPSSLPIQAFGLVFSRDGSHYAYGATQDNRNVLVLDGRSDGRFGCPVGNGAVFSPDGKRLAYPASKGPKTQFVVTDGEAGPPFNRIDFLSFSADSRHVSYVGWNGDLRVPVVDGQAGPSYEFIGVSPLRPGLKEPYDRGVVLSPAGGRAAYGVRQGNSWFVVVDRQSGPTFDAIEQPQFSPDGKHVIYRGLHGEKLVLVQDGQVGPEHDWVGAVENAFSPDSRHLGYVVGDYKRFCVVMDGQPGPTYDYTGSLVYSPDGRHWAYVAKDGNKWFVVLDGQPGPTYDRIDVGATFHADGTLGYLAKKGGSLYRLKHLPQGH